MKKSLFGLSAVLVLGAFLPVLTHAQVGVSQSDFDLDASTIQVDYSPNNLTDAAQFYCFGDTQAIIPVGTGMATVTKALSDGAVNANVNSGTNKIEVSVDGSTTTNCFQQAGHYDVIVTMVDLVGNAATPVEYDFEVRASEAITPNSTITITDCSDKFANNNDVCEYEVQLRDKYDNQLAQLNGSNIEVNTIHGSDPWDNVGFGCFDPDGGSDCQEDTNFATSFFDGVRIRNNGGTFEPVQIGIGNYATLGVTSTNGTRNLEFKAIAPSIADDGADWQETVIRQYGLQVLAPEIQEDGTPHPSNMQGLTDPLYADMRFDYPIAVNLDVDFGHKPDGGAFVTLTDINVDRNAGRAVDCQLLTCDFQQSMGVGYDWSNAATVPDEYDCYPNGTHPLSNTEPVAPDDYEYCPAFGLGNYVYGGTTYTSGSGPAPGAPEGQYIKIDLLQNNDRSSGGGQVTLYSNGQVDGDGDGVPGGTGFVQGGLARNTLIAYNNLNPSGGTANNLYLEPITAVDYIFAEDPTLGNNWALGQDLNFFKANTGASGNDFNAGAGGQDGEGTKNDLQTGVADPNYYYVWRFSEIDPVDPEVQLRSYVKYTLTDDQGADQDLRYFSGQYGLSPSTCEDAVFRTNNCSSSDDTDPTYDLLVEGSVVGLVLNYDDTATNVVSISDIASTQDIRSDIAENAYRLLRESDNVLTTSDSTTGTAYRFDSPGSPSGTFNSNFSNTKNTLIIENKDLYLGYDGSVEDFILPPGKNTVIVRNGNVYIWDNMIYSDQKDSFGLILVNDAPTPYPTTGNVYVLPEVNNITGAIYADGAMITQNSGGVENDQSFTSHQKIFTGTFLTKNTIGGTKNTTNWYTPWDQDSNQAQATKYDLRKMVTYAPGQTKAKASPYASSGLETRPNKIIIIFDGKGSDPKLAPPGFTINGAVGR